MNRAQSISNLQKVVDMECSLEPCHSGGGWNRSDLATVRTSYDKLSCIVSVDELDQAFLTEDMIALQLFGICVGIKAHSTR